jgi:hypothetical protein
MKLINTQKKFVEMFTTMNMKGLFNPIVLTVNKNIVSMTARDSADTTLTLQRYKDITIEEEENMKIVFDSEEMLNAFKIFKSDEEISVNIVENTIVVSNADNSEINDVLTIPQIAIESVNAPEFPFKIVKGLPIIKNKVTDEAFEFDINATIPVKYLLELVKRANFTEVTPKIYILTIGDGKLNAVVGGRNDFQKSVSSTIDIDHEGSGTILLGAGFEEMVATVIGNIILNATEKAPVWFTSKSDKNVIYTLIAPAIEIE